MITVMERIVLAMVTMMIVIVFLTQEEGRPRHHFACASFQVFGHIACHAAAKTDRKFASHRDHWFLSGTGEGSAAGGNGDCR